MSHADRLIVSVVCGVAVCAAACEGDFASVTEVTGLRMLGLRADPPEIHPGYDGPVEFQVLWHDSAAGDDVQFGWVLCQGDLPANSGFGLCEPVDPALAPEIKEAQQGGDTYHVDRVRFIPAPADQDAQPWTVTDTEPDTDIDTDSEDTTELVIGQELAVTAVVLVCAGGELPAADTWLTAHKNAPDISDLCAGGKGLHGFKSFRATIPEPVGQPPVVDEPNSNPEIETLTVGQSTALDPDALQLACAKAIDCGLEVNIAAALNPLSYQQYHVVEFGEVRTETERPYVSWFATGGELDAAKSISDKPGQSARVKWALDEPGTYHLWAVAHDRRGGTSWRHYRVDAVAP